MDNVDQHQGHAAPGIATSKDATNVAPGITTSNKKQLVTRGIATSNKCLTSSNKNAPRGSWPYY